MPSMIWNIPNTFQVTGRRKHGLHMNNELHLLKTNEPNALSTWPVRALANQIQSLINTHGNNWWISIDWNLSNIKHHNSKRGCGGTCWRVTIAEPVSGKYDVTAVSGDVQTWLSCNSLYEDRLRTTCRSGSSFTAAQTYRQNQTGVDDCLCWSLIKYSITPKYAIINSDDWASASLKKVPKVSIIVIHWLIAFCSTAVSTLPPDIYEA